MNDFQHYRLTSTRYLFSIFIYLLCHELFSLNIDIESFEQGGKNMLVQNFHFFIFFTPVVSHFFNL